MAELEHFIHVVLLERLLGHYVEGGPDERQIEIDTGGGACAMGGIGGASLPARG